MCPANIGIKVGINMKIIDSFKKQPRPIKILDIVFIVCIIYELILVALGKQLNMSMSLLMLFIIVVTTVRGLNN